MRRLRLARVLSALAGRVLALMAFGGTAGGGVLYWRVRAMDKDKAFKITSPVRKLIVDGGEWTMSDVDWGGGSPQVSWTCTGQGITRFRLEFSSTEGFEGGPKTVVLLAVKSPGAGSYAFSQADIKRIRALAARNGVSALYYRVRGEDADRALLTYSETKSTYAQ